MPRATVRLGLTLALAVSCAYNGPPTFAQTPSFRPVRTASVRLHRPIPLSELQTGAVIRAQGGTPPPPPPFQPDSPASPSQPIQQAGALPPPPPQRSLAQHRRLNPEMLGNQFFQGARAVVASAGGPLYAASGIRNFNIADNHSPLPHDRFYCSFNYFEGLNDEDTPFSDVRAAQLSVGGEMTFLDACASVGVRLPVNAFHTSSRFDSGFGNLTVFGKYAFWQDRSTENVLSAGLAVTLPTGERSYDNIAAAPKNVTTLQPFLGYIWNICDGLFIHGFSSLDAPLSSGEPTFLFNDIGIGYFIYQNPDSRAACQAIVPTVEFHISTPLNHRDGPGGAYDVVSISTGTNFVCIRGSSIAIGIVVPVTDPRPVDFEFIAQYRHRF